MNINNISFSLIPEYYEILFYWSFINFKREQKLIMLLETKQFEVKRTNLIFDGIFKVDLIAASCKTKYFIQLKNQKQNLNDKELLQLKHIAQLKNAIPVLAYMQNKKFKFLNLFTDKLIEL